MSATVETLEQAWPGLPWREPVKIEWPDSTMYACRICIANLGLKHDSSHQWPTESEAQQHIDEHTR